MRTGKASSLAHVVDAEEVGGCRECDFAAAVAGDVVGRWSFLKCRW